MMYHERLVDLGEAGALCLTLERGYELPLPAERYGYARWRDTAGGVHDRLDCCTRPVPARAIRKAFGKLAKGRGRRRRHRPFGEWGLAQASDAYREAPCGVAPIGLGRVLLVFPGTVLAPVFRVVDVAAGTVLSEVADAALMRRCGVGKGFFVRLIELFGARFPHSIPSGADGCAVVYFHARRAIVRIDATGVVAAGWSAPEESYDLLLTESHVAVRPNDRKALRILEAATGSEVAPVPPRFARELGMLATGAATERIAACHDDGTVEIFEADRSAFGVRPFPRAATPFRTWLARDGRHLLCESAPALRVVDLDARRVADLPPVPPDQFPGEFTGEIGYHPDACALADGVLLASRRELTFAPYDSLSWEPVIEPGRVAIAEAPAVARALAAWRRPALAFVPGEGGRTQMYGMPALPAAVAWPEHEGRPMMLLCQVDLAEAARHFPDTPWPSTGALLVFVAADESGAPLEDDSFNPKAHRIVWVPELAPAPATREGAPAADAQPMRLAIDRMQLPRLDAAIVRAHESISDAEIEHYRARLEEEQPGEAPGGHRFGGYRTVLQNNDLEMQADAERGGTGGEDAAGLRAASRWRLLLQVDSDDVFMWGTDSGTLYFMIHDDDLARRDFSRVVARTEGF